MAFHEEIALLQAMYPDETHYDLTTLQFSFKCKSGAIELRLPHTYPSTSLPDLITATGPNKQDLRVEVNQILTTQQSGEPCLDAIIAEFSTLIENLSNNHMKEDEAPSAMKSSSASYKTSIIWVHHLLASGKRKQALFPGGAGATRINGMTKPGYPGVLIFSGPAEAVKAHVQVLKHLRWQAFQVRCETDAMWSFRHGQGIIEVETMSEVVAGLEAIVEQRDMFMEAMKIK